MRSLVGGLYIAGWVSQSSGRRCWSLLEDVVGDYCDWHVSRSLSLTTARRTPTPQKANPQLLSREREQAGIQAALLQKQGVKS
jgi:hypothetical protein